MCIYLYRHVLDMFLSQSAITEWLGWKGPLKVSPSPLLESLALYNYLSYSSNPLYYFISALFFLFNFRQ